MKEYPNEKTKQSIQDWNDVNTSKVIAVMAHDLKDPFESMVGITDILIANWKNFSEEEKLGILKDIHYTSETTCKLLNDLVKWSKRQIVNPTPDFQAFDASVVAKETIESSSRKARWKGMVVKNDIPVGSLVLADRNMVAAVFRNLVNNAIKSTTNGGWVQISAIMHEKETEFSVADNGIGMTTHQIDQVFKGKDHNGSARLDVNSSNGLGLYLVNEFIRINNGRIWADSQPGKGTSVRFTLPLPG